MIHIYHGDGKGKTTAAIGLSVRALGNEIPVLFLQFLKSGGSGEMRILQELEGIRVITPAAFFGFFKNMTEEQKELAVEDYSFMLDHVTELLEDSLANEELFGLPMVDEDEERPTALIVLDEVLHAVNTDLIAEHNLLAHIKAWQAMGNVEIVLTGRNPSPGLVQIADYITNMTKERHPFDEGIYARSGIEQ